MHGNKFRACLLAFAASTAAATAAAATHPHGTPNARHSIQATPSQPKPTPAPTQTPAPVPEAQGARVGDLARIQEERLLAKARLDLLTMQGQLKAAGAKNGQVDQSYAPTVKAVLGTGGRLYATFAYPGNMTMDAKVGDVITGGYTVESIGVDQVVLSRDGKKLRLGFSASPPTPLPDAQAGAGTFAPGFNTGMPSRMPR
ncbi:type IV pilus biogenesis protein PilP [Castellaniella sp. UC4442_H9]